MNDNDIAKGRRVGDKDESILDYHTYDRYRPRERRGDRAVIA